MQEENTRESIEVDVLIIGAGPAGLATAIKLKTEANKNNQEINIVVLEKGSEVGAHILSGAVIDPIGPAGSLRIPNFFFPRLMSNHNCFATSLSNVVKWLGGIAQSLGIEVYPGFPASEIIYQGDRVVGVITGDFGISRNGEKKDSFMQGMEIRAKYTVFAEGARGHLTKKISKNMVLD